VSVILAPNGHPATKREIRITNARLAKFAAFADDAFRQLQLGVVCAACGQPPVMNNAVTDSHWKMECACTVRVLTNPSVQSSVTGVRH
jgi:hypothetical protein